MTDLSAAALGLGATAKSSSDFGLFKNRLRAGVRRAMVSNPRTATPWGTGTVPITVSASAPSPVSSVPALGVYLQYPRSATGITAASVAAQYLVEGGWVSKYNPGGFNVRNTQQASPATPGTDTNYTTTAFRVSVMTDDTSITWGIYNSASYNTTGGIRFLVNDVYVSLTPTYASSSSSGIYYFTLNLSSFGWGPKKITAECQGNHQPGFVYTSRNGTVWKPVQEAKPRIIVLSDSFGMGYDPASTDQRMWDNWASQIGDLIGAEVWSSSMGGSGFVQNGNGVALTARLPDATAWTPDAVVVAMGYNDASAWASATITQTQIQTAMNTVFGGLRGALPNTPIIGVGVWPNNITTQKTSTETMAQTTLAAVGGRQAYIPLTTASPALLYGNGTVAAPTNNGNRDLYVASDTTHMSSPVGYRFLAEYIAPRFVDAIEAMV